MTVSRQAASEAALPPEEAGPPLTWRAWLLLPLVAVAAFGVVVPLWQVHLAAEPGPAIRDVPQESRARVPYAGELLPLLDRDDLPIDRLKALRERHEELSRAMRDEGGITLRDRDFVDRVLAQYAK